MVCVDGRNRCRITDKNSVGPDAYYLAILGMCLCRESAHVLVVHSPEIREGSKEGTWDVLQSQVSRIAVDEEEEKNETGNDSSIVERERHFGQDRCLPASVKW